MNATNHMAVGALIALTVKEPILALPLAFASHFVLDALPHFGYKKGGYNYALKQKASLLAVIVDLVGVVILFKILSGASALVYLAMFLTYTPDIYNFLRYWFAEKNAKSLKIDKFTKFHRGIQWCERRWGLFVEIPLNAVLLVLVSNIK